MITLTEVITDAQGDHWPITGHWCSVCGMPLHIVCVPFGTHPGCDP
jgi:hypothetical protein